MARLSIGEFAQACGLTPKALRLYDELGLLPPDHVDPHSGYRSYARAQLERARLVAWLRRLGMPLARIRVVSELPSLAASAEVASYWRQVEADTEVRKELACFLIDHLSRKDAGMTDVNPTIELRHGAHVDTGLLRQTNEDALYAGKQMFAVADGFGTQGMQRSASSAAVTVMENLDIDTPTADLLTILGDGAENARSAVHEFIESGPAFEESGTTLTAMLWSGPHFALAHVGDSRTYLFRAGELTQLTHDHTYVRSLVEEGKLSAEEAAAHPQRATLLRSLHRHDQGRVADLHLREAHPGDRYLLCSDGLHSVLSEHQLHDVLDTAATPQDAVNHFARLVDDAGAPDNCAWIVLDSVAC